MNPTGAARHVRNRLVKLLREKEAEVGVPETNGERAWFTVWTSSDRTTTAARVTAQEQGWVVEHPGVADGFVVLETGRPGEAVGVVCGLLVRPLTEGTGRDWGPGAT